MKQYVTRQSGNTLLALLVGLVIVAGLAGTGWYVYQHQRQLVATPSVEVTTPASTTDTQPSSQTSSGTDNASLQADLNATASSMNQQDKDAAGTNGALNDNQSQIIVPTN